MWSLSLQARELSTLTGSSVLLLVVSGKSGDHDMIAYICLLTVGISCFHPPESGVVYTYTTEKCEFGGYVVCLPTRSCL